MLPAPAAPGLAFATAVEAIRDGIDGRIRAAVKGDADNNASAPVGTSTSCGLSGQKKKAPPKSGQLVPPAPAHKIETFENPTPGAGGNVSVEQRANGSTVCKIYCGESGLATWPVAPTLGMGWWGKGRGRLPKASHLDTTFMPRSRRVHGLRLAPRDHSPTANHRNSLA